MCTTKNKQTNYFNFQGRWHKVYELHLMLALLDVLIRFPPMYFQAILLGIGLQHKSVEDLEKELETPSSQILGLFNRLLKKIVQVITVCDTVFILFVAHAVISVSIHLSAL